MTYRVKIRIIRETKNVGDADPEPAIGHGMSPSEALIDALRNLPWPLERDFRIAYEREFKPVIPVDTGNRT